MNASTPPNHRDRWALLIGVDRYARLASHQQLHGCVNDVELLASILVERFGFPAGHVTLLRDQAATRAGILSAMYALLDRVERDDDVVLAYSGHGSQMTDREGDEPDGLDETIVPHDSGRGRHPNRDITDDEIYAWLLRLGAVTPYVTLIFDCCHSGTITRDAFGAQARWVEPDTRPIADLPPSPVRPVQARQAGRELGATGWLPLSDRYVLIAGCRDEESSYEYRVYEGGKVTVHGALTYFLARELIRAGAATTYRDVLERAAAQVTSVYRRQHPQMEGARDRELFGVRQLEPMRFLPVRRRVADRVTLGGGAAHGLTVGSQWAVHPQATKRVTAGMPTLGLVEIARVDAVSAEARILEEAGARAIGPDDRAVERAHAHGEMRLVVDLQGSADHQEARARLAALIEASPLLREAAAGELADVRVYLIPPRPDARPDDPVPQLGGVATVTWAVVGPDGRLMMPVHAVDEAEVIGLLRDNLEKAARYRHALALRNPDPQSPLRDKVDLMLGRLSPDGSWAPAEREAASGMVVFEEGERMALQVVNRYTAPVYVSVLDFGLSGAVNLVHPVAGASERLAPRQTIRIGVREGDEVRPYLPEGFPFAPDPGEDPSTVVGGVETIKLLATSHAADFSVLVQGGFRDLEPPPFQGAGTPLGQLLNMALTGHGTRDIRRHRVPPDEAWTTVERSFFLRRRVL